MQLIVGLGNPGTEYDRTRHNVGFLVVDVLAKQLGMPPFAYKKDLHAEVAKSAEYLIIKPTTYMNDSGRAVRAVLDFYKDAVSSPLEDNLLVVHDDLDIAFGEYKLQKGKRPKVHNGITSVQAHIQTESIWYLRVGIDGREGDRSIPGRAYVLQRFSLAEQQQLERTALQNMLPDILARFTR